MDNHADFFKKNLRTLMKQKGWGNKDLAEALGVSPPVVSRYLTTDTLPSFENAKAIAEALGITIDDLIRDPSRVTMRDLANGKISESPSSKKTLTLPEIVEILNSVEKAKPERRALGLFFLTGNPEFLAECPEFRPAAEALLQELKLAR